MIMLYHGSNQEIGEIDLQLGLPDKDFGRGFYLTQMPAHDGKAYGDGL